MTKQERSPSVGEVVDYFLEYYDFPRRSDFFELTARIAFLENLLQEVLADRKRDHLPAAQAPPKKKRARTKKKSLSATDAILLVMKKHGGSLSFKEILEKTNFDDKKVRNIVFRLNKLGKIIRKDRGIYALPPNTDL